MSSNIETSETFNNHFLNIVNNLNIPKNENSESPDLDPIIKATQKYQKHPSIIAIKSSFQEHHKNVSFSEISYETVLKEIKKLDTSKAYQEKDIPTKIIKENANIFARVLRNNFNKYLNNGTIPEILKNAVVNPIFKKGSKLDKSNYRPIRILSNISKPLERCIFQQINQYFEPIFSRFQCGFRKGHLAQDTLINMHD